MQILVTIALVVIAVLLFELIIGLHEFGHFITAKLSGIKVNEFALQGIMPDMTFLMDLDAQEGISRKKNQAELDRMENEKMEFHQKVVDGYRMLADMHTERIVKIDATLPIDEIHGIIVGYVEKKLNL